MIRRPPRSTHCISSAASDVYKRQVSTQSTWDATRDSGACTAPSRSIRYPTSGLPPLRQGIHRGGPAILQRVRRPDGRQRPCRVSGVSTATAEEPGNRRVLLVVPSRTGAGLQWRDGEGVRPLHPYPRGPLHLPAAWSYRLALRDVQCLYRGGEDECR
eukprot:TRINITY_DN16763_c0_g1_i1.p4 TRINITY_DN16763_c0_g1~~TRINITY_DN16763_c0_g1_i1.p4  ORF type:complete len:158 (-),score=10.62 TRINITY_DN16763_c0_g1_i1:312-785(-)